jgi:hypothetical protein
MDPTPMEESGLVDREKLKGFNGRGRKDQLALAEHFGITEIPTPGGGCKLTEKENTRRFWPVLTRFDKPMVNDFLLADTGRQFWMDDRWLAIGRHKSDNDAYAELQQEGDLRFRVAGFPSPIAIGRSSRPWDAESVQKAAAFMASYSPKAVRAAEEGETISVRVTQGGQTYMVQVKPSRETEFAEPTWEAARDELYALRKPAKKNEEQAESGLE